MSLISRQLLSVMKKEVTNYSHIGGFARKCSYKSAYSLDKLYPSSNINIYTPKFTPLEPDSKFDGYIPVNKLRVIYVRSSGPGGQHVNKTNTKVCVHLNLKSDTWLHEDIRKKLAEQNENKITKDGCIVIKSEATRSQHLNMAHVLDKLRTMIRKTLEKPAEISAETEEVLRKRQMKAARQRVFTKRHRQMLNSDIQPRD